MEGYFSNDAWLQERLGRFTASDVYKIFVGGRKKDELFGQGALTYIRQKAAEVITQEVKEQIDFKQAEWGKANEAEACERFRSLMGVTGEYFGMANPTFFTYGQNAGGSPDWEDIKELIGADFKCPYNSEVHLQNLLFDDIEEYKKERWEYYCQGQANMLTRGWKKFYAVSYDPRFPLPLQIKIIEFGPDQEWIEEYETRLSAASKLKQSFIDSLSAKSVMVAEHDKEENVTIVHDENALKI